MQPAKNNETPQTMIKFFLKLKRFF